MIEIGAWGVATSLRDGGRPGLAHLGKSRGGAVDLVSLALANRLVGNDEAAMSIETSGGLTLTMRQHAMLAITGAAADLVVHDGPSLGWGTPTVLPPGATVRVGMLHTGARVYVAVRGGLIDRGGGVIGIGAAPTTSPGSTSAVPPLPADRIRLWPGPRRDWFTDEAWEALLTAPFAGAAESDRVGLRLTGPTLGRAVAGELPSEGLIEGSIQVPPSGQPIVMLADHPTTGGYPVIAVVDPRDLTHVAQTRPGDPIRFRLAR